MHDEQGTPGIAASAARGLPPSGTSLIYALGRIGYDFGTQARMDAFVQRMGPDQSPFNPGQLLNFLAKREVETRMLIWTLNIEQTPLYAIEPGEPFAQDIYAQLAAALEGQMKEQGDAAYIERVSLPGYLTGKTVRLYSGQVVPVVSALARGLYCWDVNKVIEDAVNAAGANHPPEQVHKMRIGLREFLHRMGYHFRNLGLSPSERAMNFAATTAAAQMATALAQHLIADSGSGSRQLANIAVEKSPLCRPGSDYWDVRLAFFDPASSRHVMRIVRYTIDVSDVMPVTVGEPKSWEADSF